MNDRYADAGRKASQAKQLPAEWFRFMATEFLAETRGMRPDEVGVYIIMIATMHETSAPLADDVGKLARLCNMTRTARMTEIVEELVADGKIIRSDEGLWSPVIEREIGFRREKSRLATAAVVKRHEKNEQNQRAIGTDVTRDKSKEIESSERGAQAPLSTDRAPRFTVDGSDEDSPSPGGPLYRVGQDVEVHPYGVCEIVKMQGARVDVRSCTTGEYHTVNLSPSGKLPESNDDCPF